MSRAIQIPIYMGWLYVAHNSQEYDRLYGRHILQKGERLVEDPLAFAPGGLTACYVNSSGALVIVSGVWPKRHSVACHEATHCAQFLAENRGLDPIVEKEAFAYLVQWFFDQLTAKG